jgi:alpha-1,6-mannosyltransferase
MDRIIHNNQALWAQENTPEALAAAIKGVARNNLKNYAYVLHERVSQRYSWKQIFARLFGLYRQVIDEEPR